MSSDATYYKGWKEEPLSLYLIHSNTTLQVVYKQHVCFLCSGPSIAFVPYCCLY